MLLETLRTMPKKKLPTGPIRIDLPSMGMERKLESEKQDSDKIENNKIESEKKDSIQVENALIEFNKQESNQVESNQVDSSNIENSLIDSNSIERSIIEPSQEDSNKAESSMAGSYKKETDRAKRSSKEFNKLDSRREENSKLTSLKKEKRIEPSTLVDSESSIREDSNQESSLPENRITESTLNESSQVELITPEEQNQDNKVVLSELKPESSLLESKKVAMRLSSEAASTLRQFRAETGIPYEIIVDVMIRSWSSLPNRTKTSYLKQAKQIRQMRLMAGQEKTLETMRQKYLDK